MAEIDRRKFLKIGLAVAAGVGVESIMLPVKIGTAFALEQISKTETGNAYTNDKMKKDDCQNPDEQANCITKNAFSAGDRVLIQFTGPIFEEALFRTAPSLVLSKLEGAKDPIDEARYGTGGLGMTRREMIWGGVSSAVFAILHNITPKGFDTRIIPAPQFLGGLSAWYLQRRFGIIANITGHIFTNSVAMWAYDNS